MPHYHVLTTKGVLTLVIPIRIKDPLPIGQRLIVCPMVRKKNHYEFFLSWCEVAYCSRMNSVPDSPPFWNLILSFKGEIGCL